MTADATPASRIGPRHKTRITAVLFFFAVWFVIILARLSQYMVFAREQHLAAMTRVSTFEGLIPAARGRLLDRSGVPLAWSERRFCLVWSCPADPVAAQGQLERILEALPQGNVAVPVSSLGGDRGEVVLCSDLSAAAAASLGPLLEELPGLRLSGRFVRLRHPGHGEHVLGQIIEDDGTEVGLSGLELTHDAFLRGHPGLFRVMLDKQGAWIPETWEKVRDMRPGYDVYLPFRAASLTANET